MFQKGRQAQVLRLFREHLSNFKRLVGFSVPRRRCLYIKSSVLFFERFLLHFSRYITKCWIFLASDFPSLRGYIRQFAFFKWFESWTGLCFNDMAFICMLNLKDLLSLWCRASSFCPWDSFSPFFFNKRCIENIGKILFNGITTTFWLPQLFALGHFCLQFGLMCLWTPFRSFVYTRNTQQLLFLCRLAC